MSEGTSIDLIDYQATQLPAEAKPSIPGLDARQPEPSYHYGRRARLGVIVQDVSGLLLTFENGVPAVDPAVRPSTDAIKRGLDILLSFGALVVLLPVFVLIAMAIKFTSPGPVFFRQAREGLNGEIFSIYKFRTMYPDRCDASGIAQTQRDDDRVTPIGRLLRKKSLDELPQLFNVLKGEMSIIGPRPHVPGMLAGGQRYDDLVPYYPERLRVKPGLSGWAQVNGLRGPTKNAMLARLRIDHDLAYAANHSIALDLKIIQLTLWREVINGQAD
ncbi:sugar transferase [Pelagibacterium limicola]|uniref:sugar transferase n=1 Tax=Pelagibacterium limicola TaxID=2791022 RepID=UPI0018AFB1E5|nr:sugar transferase [Pelagibacterium limicola]